MVDTGDDARHAELGLGEERDDEVDLVVAGGGHHDLALGEVSLLEGRQLTRVRLEHLREGQLVEAWFDEQVMESFPVQAHATAIRVSN